MSELTTSERIAQYGGAGLLFLGTLVIGLLEMLAGSSHPVTSDGQIEHEALVPLEIRSYIILLALLIWAGYAVYRVVAVSPADRSTGAP